MTEPPGGDPLDPAAGSPDGDPAGAPGPAPEAGGADPTGPPTCASCGAALEPDQTYCLECGAPTPLAPALRRRRRGLVAAATTALLLGGAAGALSYHFAASGNGGRAPAGGILTDTIGAVLPTDTTLTTGTGGVTGTPSFGSSTQVLSTDTGLPDTSRINTSPTGTGFTGTGFTGTGFTDTGLTDTGFTDTGFTDTGFTGTGRATTTTGAATTSSTPGGTRASSDDWPAGRSGWTVQLASVRQRTGAEALAARLRTAGEPAGVLRSGDHGGYTRPGYWVVFSGIYGSRAAALAHERALGTAWGPTILHQVTS